MILSNKKLRLIIIALLLLIFSYFLGLMKPKAQVVDYIMNESQTQTTSGNIAHAFNGSGGIFQNQGQGKIIYQFLVTGKRNINTIAIETDNSMSVCDFGTTSGYNDSATQQVFYSIVCNVDLSNNNKAINLLIYGYSWENTIINWGRTIQFSNFENGNDYTQVLSNVDANLNSISSAVWSIKNNSDLIKQYLQTMVNNNTTINNNVSDIKDSINDSSIDSSGASSSASTWNSKNATNGTITQLLTLPITLLQAIVNGLQTSCSSFSLGSLFNTNIVLPCINVGNLIGSGLWTTIDILFSGFMILSIAKKLIKIFNDFTNLKSNQIDELYGGGSK